MTWYVTQSEMKAYMRCKRRWWLSVYRGLRIKKQAPAGALALGTNIHEVLAEWYAFKNDPMVAFDAIYGPIVAELASQVQLDVDLLERVNKDYELGRIMLEGYLQWVSETGADIGLRVVGVEERVDVPLPIDGVRLLGKLDIRMEDENSLARWFLDHKTTGSLTEPMKTLHMDFQMLTYMLLLYLKVIEEGRSPIDDGILVAGGMYNMLKKVKRTARATPPFYGRETITHSVIELRNFYTRVLGIVSDMQETRARLDRGDNPILVAYPTPTGQCSWDCEWRLVCPMFDDGSDHERWLADFATSYDPLERYAERTEE